MKKTTFAASLSLYALPVFAAEDALSFSASNTLDLLGNLQGGIKTGSQALEKFDLDASFTGANAGLSGWDGYVHLQWTHDNDFSGALVGDAQAVSNIEAPQGIRVMNAWVSRSFSDNAGIKLGIIDLNSEFDIQNPGAIFLNSSSGIAPDYSQSGENAPSIFPSTGLGIVSWWQPTQDWELKAGIFEGIPGNPAHPGRTDLTLSGIEGALLTFETRFHFSPAFTLGVGGWHYTAGFAPIGAAGTAYGNNGFYGIIETTLIGTPGEGPRLDGWLRAGVANARINPIQSYVGGGLVYSEPFGRENDQIGVAFSHAMFGMPARLAGGLDTAETALELTYSFALTDWAVIQPDFQYVIRPGGDPTLENAVVAGARIILSWP